MHTYTVIHLAAAKHFSDAQFLEDEWTQWRVLSTEINNLRRLRLFEIFELQN